MSEKRTDKLAARQHEEKRTNTPQAAASLSRALLRAGARVTTDKRERVA